ncbi:MAG TPA: hypothetical protein VLF95_11850, partial [Vicinamibacteria bacterium]|nr:hypothetical protein [Vicinamibacteria bacterium]
MLQRYKVRLGDGTVLQVDLDGLRTWLTDSRATVQVAATQEWRPLRQFLADEESAARLARALVPPQPRRSPASSPSEAPLPGLPAEPAIGAPPLVQALADETATSDTWRDTGEDAAAEAPAIRLKPLDDERPAPRASARARAYAVEEEEEEEEGDERHDGLEGPLLRVIATFGALLSRCLDPLTAL